MNVMAEAMKTDGGFKSCLMIALESDWKLVVSRLWTEKVSRPSTKVVVESMTFLARQIFFSMPSTNVDRDSTRTRRARQNVPLKWQEFDDCSFHTSCTR